MSLLNRRQLFAAFAVVTASRMADRSGATVQDTTTRFVGANDAEQAFNERPLALAWSWLSTSRWGAIGPVFIIDQMLLPNRTKIGPRC